MIIALLGFVIGAIGTLIGVGGGFLLVPILLFLHPEKTNMWVGGMSLWMIAVNATSGSISYYKKGTIHLKAALAFIIVAIPGSIGGVMLQHYVSRDAFEKIFASALAAYAVVLLFRKKDRFQGKPITAITKLSRNFYVQGCLISFVVGFLAAFLGLGGGVIHVPLLSHVMGFPVHLATGTSQLILAVTAWFATAVHIWHGDISLTDPMVWQLGGGAALGAQLGARFSSRVSGAVIMKILAVALLVVALRLLLR